MWEGGGRLFVSASEYTYVTVSTVKRIPSTPESLLPIPNVDADTLAAECAGGCQMPSLRNF